MWATELSGVKGTILPHHFWRGGRDCSYSILTEDRNMLRGSCELTPFWLKPLLCPSSSSFDHRKFKFSHPPTPELSSENLHTTNPECDLDPTLLGSPSRSPLHMDASKHRARCSGFENSSKRYIPNRLRNQRRTLPPGHAVTRCSGEFVLPSMYNVGA